LSDKLNNEMSFPIIRSSFGKRVCRGRRRIAYDYYARASRYIFEKVNVMHRVDWTHVRWRLVATITTAYGRKQRRTKQKARIEKKQFRKRNDETGTILSVRRKKWSRTRLSAIWGVLVNDVQDRVNWMLRTNRTIVPE